MALQLRLVPGSSIPVDLLRQQLYRADNRALATADAVQFRPGLRQCRENDGTVGRLLDGNGIIAHGLASHGAADHQVVRPIGVASGGSNQAGNRRADSRQHIDWLRDAVARHRGYPFDQWPCTGNPVSDRGDRGDVLHDATDIARQSATGYLYARNQLDQLVLCTGRVDRRDLPQRQAWVLCFAQCRIQADQCCGLVTLHGDDSLVDAENVQQDLRSGDNIGRSFPHQHVIAADIGFTFNAIDYQVLQVALPRAANFLGGGENGAAKPGDAAFPNKFGQGFRRLLAIVSTWRCGSDEAVFAIRLNDDAAAVVALASKYRPGRNRLDDAG